jgi:hypothetical protein
MSGSVTCACGKEYRWKSEFAGKRAKCKCGGVVAFPKEHPTLPPLPPPPPAVDVPEGFEDAYAMAGDDAPPPPPPPPISSRPAPAAAAKGGFKDSTKAAGDGGGFRWNWKAALNILIGLGLIVVGFIEYADIAHKEAVHQEVHFTGRRSGWLTIMYAIGGKFGVLGFFVVAGILFIGGAVLVMMGKIAGGKSES